MTFGARLLGALRLDPLAYEDVEHDPSASLQAVAVVLLSSAAAAVGLSGAVWDPGLLSGAALAALLGWVAWAVLVYAIGVMLLPTPETRATLGELLRTTGFAAAPGIFRALLAMPGLIGTAIFALVSVWMLVAMVLAVKQALDYASTGRALAVCLLGWALSTGLVVMWGLFYGPALS
jgi:hypothetical protein